MYNYIKLNSPKYNNSHAGVIFYGGIFLGDLSCARFIKKIEIQISRNLLYYSTGLTAWNYSKGLFI